jgi:starch-binding outer membrane protein, SusD/RagB family
MKTNIFARVRRKTYLLLGLCATIAVAMTTFTACDQNFNAPDPNAPTTDAAIPLQPLITGTLANWRYTEINEFLGIMGRESYTSAGDDPRINLQPSTNAFDATAFIVNRPWNSMYYTVKNARNLIDFAARFSGAEKAGVEGVARTIWAHELMRLSNAYYNEGIKIEYRLDRNAPFVPRAQSLAEAARLLDEAATNLRAAGSSFTFSLGNGFAGFSTPQGFLRANRAIRARVAAYQGDYSACQTALSESFLTEGNTSEVMRIGIYHTYSTASGDVPPGSGRGSGGNPFFQNLAAPSIRWWVHRNYVGDNLDSLVDTRVTQKAAIPTNIALPAAIIGPTGLTSSRAVNIFPEPNFSTTIIRNEELLLLRAEARMLGTMPDVAGALADINRVRAASNAPALTTIGADRTAQITRLLYERRYSLFFEGFRWVDLRRFDRFADIRAERTIDRINTTGLPKPVNDIPQ